MTETKSREIRLKNRPMGMATENDFELVEVMIPEIEEGQIQWKETILHGIENAPKAFLSLFAGESFGKMLVKL